MSTNTFEYESTKEEEWKTWNACIQKARAYSVSLPNEILEKLLNSGGIVRIREGVDIYMFAFVPYDSFLGYAPEDNTIGTLIPSK